MHNTRMLGRFSKLQDSLIRLSEWILDRELFALAPLGLLVLFPHPAGMSCFLLLPGLWALRRWRRGYFLHSTPFNLPLLVFFAALLFIPWISPDVRLSLAKLYGLLFGLGVFFATLNLCRSNPEGIEKATCIFAACGMLVALVGILGTDWREKLPLFEGVANALPTVLQGLPGAEGGIHPNELGGVLILFVPLALTMALREQLWRGRSSLGRRLAWGAAAILTSGVAILTQSRSALVGLAAGLALLLALSGQYGRLAVAICLLLAMAGGMLFLTQPGIGERELADATTPPMGNLAIERRVEIWSRASYGLRDFLISGIGLGMFRHEVTALYPVFYLSPEEDIAHAHNLFLQAGLDLGLMGLVAYLALWLVAFSSLWNVYRRARTALQGREVYIGGLAAGLAGGLLGHLIFGVTDAVALGARPGFLWWMALGLVAGVSAAPGARPSIRGAG
jgi:putative inorganic carbon (HCO3(-)) transporter